MTKAINRLIPQPAGEVTRTTMYLDDYTRDTARKIGDGNMSAGWRLLAAAARAEGSDLTKIKHSGADQLFAEHKAER